MIANLIATASGIAIAVTVGSSVAGASPSHLPKDAFGSPHEVVDGSVPQVVLSYTVQDLQRSGNQVLDVPLVGRVPLAGELWDATTTVHAVQGSAVPDLPSFYARTDDGHRYPMLRQTLTPDLPASPLDEGKTSKLQIYFDVTDSAPTAVVYDDGTHVPVVWQ
jgi:hypothetical protein